MSKILIESFFFEKQLQILQLNNLSFGSTEIKILADNVKNITTLKSFTLYDYNKKSLLDLNDLAPALVANKNIRILDLSYNLLRLEGLTHLMESLPNLKFLQKLLLIQTQLDKDAMEYLATVWRNPNSPLPISILHLDSNKINAAGLHKLIDGNTFLKNLYVDFCDINDRDIELLAPLLSNPERCHLDLCSWAL